MRDIKTILMERDGASEQDAENQIQEAREELYDLLDQGDFEGAEDICADYFGLEPDYLDCLI